MVGCGCYFVLNVMEGFGVGGGGLLNRPCIHFFHEKSLFTLIYDVL